MLGAMSAPFTLQAARAKWDTLHSLLMSKSDLVQDLDLNLDLVSQLTVGLLAF